jgi:hypothetical protein
MTPGQMVSNYLRLRDHKKKAQEEFKKGMARVTDGMNKLEAQMLDHLNNTDTKSIPTDGGTAYIIRRFNATVKDREDFLQWCKVHDEWDAIDLKANKKWVEEFGDEIPGVKVTTLNQIGVRR